MRGKETWIKSAWNKVKQHPIIFGVIALSVIILSILAYQHFVLGYTWLDCTGFGTYQITKIDPTTTRATEIQIQTRTLWDWLELLIVPAVLAAAAIWFNTSQRKNEIKIAEERTKSDREIAADRLNEELLQSYIDRMTELLLDKGLRKSSSEDEIRDIARTRTLTALRGLDAGRKGLLLRFLYEAGLITGQGESDCIVNLYQADLGDADLEGATLSNAHLNGVDLREAKLSMADLKGAYLIGAYLDWAQLFDANLSGAYLREAYIGGASLRETDLCDADLSGADLNRADLGGADFTGADLSGANLSGANLRGATITPDQLSQVKSLGGATLSDGSKHE